MSDTVQRPPKENLVRGVLPFDEIRDSEDGSPTLVGHFAVFDEWTEIRSAWEGHFLERIARGAFKKTIAENRDGMRLLFQHGNDPELGDKPIGRIGELSEDERGAYYEASLYKGLPPLVMEGLRDGQYGASFRFKVMREEFEKRPGESDHNPDGLPERTITEARVSEFGPVTFPAYLAASAGVRSLTDDFIFRTLVGDPDRFAELLQTIAPSTTPDAAGMGTSGSERREYANRFRTREEFLSWISET